MAKFQIDKISKEERYKIIGEFYDIVANLKNKNDVFGFFMGLLTPSEALMFARRIQVAIMLLKEESYDNIKKKLGVGDSTIAAVARWLSGDNDGFKIHIEKHKKRKDELEKNQSSKSRYRSLLDKYPQHRIIKDILDL